MRLRSVVGAAAMAALMAAGGPAAAQDVVWRTQGVTKTEIVIGVHSDLSGVASPFGIGSTNAFRMRVDEVNAEGGIHGRKIRLVIEDTQYQVPKAVQAANKLLHRDKVFAILGGLGTPMNNAVLKEQLAAGVPNLFPITAARQMQEPLHPLKFAGFAPYYDNIRAGLKWFIENRGKQRVCIMYQDTDFGQEVLDGVREQLEAMKRPLIEKVTHKPTDQDFTAQLARLKAADCDLVVLGSIIRDAIFPFATSRKMGWNVDMVGASATYDFAVSAAQGGITEGLYAIGQILPPYRDGASPEQLAWIDRYKDRFGSDPSISAALGYVAVDLTVFALDKAGPDLTTEKLVKALESVDGYRDIFGGPPISFSAKSHGGTNEGYIFQVKGGKWVPVTDRIKP